MVVFCPSTEEVIETVPDSIDQDANDAVEAARRAFDRGPRWRARTAERIRTLEAVIGYSALRELAEHSRRGLPQPVRHGRDVRAPVNVGHRHRRRGLRGHAQRHGDR
jgi:Aldehyde dehydrogenase family